MVDATVKRECVAWTTQPKQPLPTPKAGGVTAR
jgi:hypothetical protein